MKRIILTGSSSGFGLVAAQFLASQGNQVFATMRNIKGKNAKAAQELLRWGKENNAEIHVVELDVSSDQSVENAIKEITAISGNKIDVVINNAGVGYLGVAESLTSAQTEQMFQVNVIGADRVIKAVLPYMHQQKEGHIINVTSVQARNHMPLFTTYNATKAALDALSVGYFYELQTAGIDVSVIQPGGYPTTDIISNGLIAGNPAVQEFYGERLDRLKNAIIQFFVPNENSPNIQEVAEAMAKLIDLPKGKRPLWVMVGPDGHEKQIGHINESTQALVDLYLSEFGV